MIKKHLHSNNNKLIENIASLGLIQVANFLIPLLIIPYIARALGVEAIGKVGYAQTIISYLTIIVNYGFEYSATQDIAIHKNDKKKLHNIFWAVIKNKAIFLFFTFILLFFLYLFTDFVRQEPLLYLSVALMNIGIVLFPTWFFQGIEKMKGMAIFNFLIKLFGSGITVFLVSSPEDYIIYALLPSLSYVVFGFLSFVYIIKKYDLFPFKNDKEANQQALKKGFPIFLNTFFVSLYTTANFTILGFFVNDIDLGLYAGAYKIIMAINIITVSPISMGIFPLISQKFEDSLKSGFHFLKKILFLFGGLSAIISFITYIFAEELTLIILGKEFYASIDLLKYFSITTFLVILGTLLTVQGLYGAKLQRYAPWIGFILSVFCISLNFILIPILGVKGSILSWIFTQVLEIIIVSTILRIFFKKNLV